MPNKWTVGVSSDTAVFICIILHLVQNTVSHILLELGMLLFFFNPEVPSLGMHAEFQYYYHVHSKRDYCEHLCKSFPFYDYLSCNFWGSSSEMYICRGAALCSGYLHPDAILHRERWFRTNKRTYHAQLQTYHKEYAIFQSVFLLLLLLLYFL